MMKICDALQRLLTTPRLKPTKILKVTKALISKTACLVANDTVKTKQTLKEHEFDALTVPLSNERPVLADEFDALTVPLSNERPVLADEFDALTVPLSNERPVLADEFDALTVPLSNERPVLADEFDALTVPLSNERPIPYFQYQLSDVVFPLPDKTTKIPEVTKKLISSAAQLVANAPADTNQALKKDESDAQTARLIDKRLKPDFQYQLSDVVFPLSDKLQKLLDDVDLGSAPGLAGDFCNELARYEMRILKEPRIIAALNVLALTRSKQGLYNGMKSGFFSIVAALSACGKEKHQVFQQQLFDAMSMNDVIVASVTSGKQVHETLAFNQTPVLISDECHILFKAAASGTDFGALDTIMLMITANVARFPFKTRRELIDSLRALIAKLQKDKTLIPTDKAMLKRLIESEKKLSKNDWQNPYFAYVGYSTPINTDFIVNPQNIDSGLMGRPIFMRIAEYRDELNPQRDLNGPTDSLVQRFNACFSNEGAIEMSDEAAELVKAFTQYFELNRNHREFGAIFARGTEHILRVSSLLAAESLVITKAEVLYAAKLFLRSLDSIQEVKSGKSRNFLFQSALETIQRHAAGKKLSIAVLANKLIWSNRHIRAYQEQDRDIAKIMVQQAIDEGFLVLKNNQVELVVVDSTQDQPTICEASL